MIAMYPCFDVDGILVERLLIKWNWLMTGSFRLLAVNPFGDHFLSSAQGTILLLDVSSGEIATIADSEEEFRKRVAELANQNEWFLLEDERRAAQKGYVPGKAECIGAKIPWVFKESAAMPDNLYVADLYEYVAFMGDLHRQISDVANGGKVQLRVEPEPRKSRVDH
jgi:hypothetical protein